MTNKAMYLMAPGLVELRDVELREINENEVLVKTEFSAISAGTELANFNDLPNTVRKYPRNFGYNAVGIVEKVGAAVKNYKVGDRVLVEVNPTTSYYVEIRKITKGEDDTEIPISGY